eukprot:jgi/Hompol1/6389/HPOL_004964-RA
MRGELAWLDRAPTVADISSHMTLAFLFDGALSHPDSDPDTSDCPAWMHSIAAAARSLNVWIATPQFAASSLADFTLDPLSSSSSSSSSLQPKCDALVHQPLPLNKPSQAFNIMDSPAAKPCAETFADTSDAPESPASLLTSTDTASVLSDTATSNRAGVLYLIGAGPGSPDLLTFRAHKILTETAHLIIADRLVSPQLLATLPPSRLRFTRKIIGKAQEAQQEIHEWILEALSKGLTVARLKGGDPFVFGRGGEEAIIALKHGYSYHIVPGISSAFAAPAMAGIPVTHRGVADTVVVSTGRREDGSLPDVVPYRSHRTCVYLMAMGTLERLVSEFLREGYPANLPVAVIERASYRDQNVVYATVESVVQVVRASGIKAHATLVVGNVVYALDIASEIQMDLTDRLVELQECEQSNEALPTKKRKLESMSASA